MTTLPVWYMQHSRAYCTDIAIHRHKTTSRFGSHRPSGVSPHIFVFYSRSTSPCFCLARCLISVAKERPLSHACRFEIYVCIGESRHTLAQCDLCLSPGPHARPCVTQARTYSRAPVAPPLRSKSPYMSDSRLVIRLNAPA